MMSLFSKMAIGYGYVRISNNKVSQITFLLKFFYSLAQLTYSCFLFTYVLQKTDSFGYIITYTSTKITCTERWNQQITTLMGIVKINWLDEFLFCEWHGKRHGKFFSKCTLQLALPCGVFIHYLRWWHPLNYTYYNACIVSSTIVLLL